MIRILLAFAWLRWRTTVHALRGRTSRDVLERASRIGAVVVPVILVILLLPVALGIGVLGFGSGYIVADPERGAVEVARVFRIVLGIVTAAVLLGPILLRMMDAGGSEMVRLLLLPIPRRLLHFSETIACVTDPWILVILPGVLLFPFGVAAGGAPGPALVAVAGSILFLAVLLLAGALVGFLTRLLYRDRRRGEMLTLVLMAVLSLAGILPMVIQRWLGGPTRGGADLPGLTVSTRLLPSEIHFAAVREVIAGRTAAALVPLTGLALSAGLLYMASWATYRRLLDSPGGGSAGRRGTTAGIGTFPFPGISRGASAVAWVHVRTVLRTVMGKMVVFLNPLLFGILALFLRQGPFPFDLLGPHGGLFFVSAGVVLTLFSLERVLLNQFAVDGAGLTLQLLAPLSDRDLVRGKVAGGAILSLLCFALFLVVVLAIVRVDPVMLAAVSLGGAATYLILAPIAALLSAIFPRTADLTKMGAASNPHPVANLLGMLLTMALLSPPGGLIGAAVLLGDSPLLALSLVAAWCAVAAGLSIPLQRMAAAALSNRRENLAMVAQGR